MDSGDSASYKDFPVKTHCSFGFTGTFQPPLYINILLVHSFWCLLRTFIMNNFSTPSRWTLGLNIKYLWTVLALVASLLIHQVMQFLTSPCTYFEWRLPHEQVVIDQIFPLSLEHVEKLTQCNTLKELSCSDTGEKKASVLQSSVFFYRKEEVACSPMELYQKSDIKKGRTM